MTVFEPTQCGLSADANPPAHRSCLEVGRSGQWRTTLVVTLLCINYGLVFFDRNSISFLMPYMRDELMLTGTRIGALSSALGVSWAASSLLISRWSDYIDDRKKLLVGSCVLFSLCTFLSGMAQGFVTLLGARLLMGAAEGGVMPMSQALVLRLASPERRGLIMGFVQNFGSNLLGTFVAPVVIVLIAERYGWRQTFFVTSLPGLAVAILLLITIKDGPSHHESDAGVGSRARTAAPPWGDILRNRNVLLCCLISSALASYYVVAVVFLPVFLTVERGLSPVAMGWLMSSFGISATIGSLIVAGVSDRLGRKPLLLILPLFGILVPFAAGHMPAQLWITAGIFLIGWLPISLFTLSLSIVPAESLGRDIISAAVIGVVMATAEIVGSVVVPLLVGLLIDRAGMDSMLWVLTLLMMVALVGAIFLRETAPNLVGRRAEASA